MKSPADKLKTHGGGSKSIRNNFEEDSDDGAEPVSPGPGSYASPKSMFRGAPRPHSLQMFGSNVKRFIESPIGTALGPGQYKPKEVTQAKYNSALKNAGQASFRSPLRRTVIGSQDGDQPAPGEYTSEQLQATIAQSVRNRVVSHDKSPMFSVKEKRFGKDDTLAPGPGSYKLPDSVQVKNKKLKMASYQSGTARELDLVKNKDAPGVGLYDVNSFDELANKGLKGGGAPNNFTVLYPNLNPTIRRVDTKVTPRLPDVEHRSKSQSLSCPGAELGALPVPFQTLLLICSVSVKRLWTSALDPTSSTRLTSRGWSGSSRRSTQSPKATGEERRASRPRRRERRSTLAPARTESSTSGTSARTTSNS